MFTGIIEEIGTIKKIAIKNEAMELHIKSNHILSDIKLGDSIAVNGVCLTVTSFGQDFFTVDIMPETFRATSMSTLVENSKVNLERALSIGDRLGGHFVTGHVDGTGEITSKEPIDNAVNYTIKINSELLKHCIYRGSIAIDGISLTIFGVSGDSIKLSLIPHTVTHTTLGQKMVGEKVNIECDMLSKHVANLLNSNKEHN